MRISIRKLQAWGPNKQTAEIEFHPPSHLVFGPTDTGKSYAVQCIRYCLGGSTRPEDIGLSGGYTRLALQIASANTGDFTLFRDLIVGDAWVYRGHHKTPPQSSNLECDENPEDFLVRLAGGLSKQLLTKSGKLGKLTADALRLTSVFDEIETLERVPLEGKDKLLKMRNRSAVSLMLSGADDSAVSLVPTTDKRNLAKGHAEALQQERDNLFSEIPQGLTKLEAIAALAKVSEEIVQLNSFVNQNSEQLEVLKNEQAEIEATLARHRSQLIALSEALERFRLLDSKYQSDRHRLAAIGQAAKVVGSLESRNCPLCLTDISHQTRHNSSDGVEILVEATKAEYEKIERLQSELKFAISELESERKTELDHVQTQRDRVRTNQLAQAALLRPNASAAQGNVVGFADRKVQLAVAIRDFERIEVLDARIAVETKKAKKQKQTVERDLSSSANSVCRRVQDLLTQWQVPGVQAVSFDESVVDIKINERRRVSYGKGKRGIFLTAYVTALMEHALDNNTPHLGFVVIDSPVVTYRDPKHGSNDPEEALDVSVKDRFYEWLSSRTTGGQLIVFENEEPSVATRSRLNFTEFVGSEGASGRKGFFPISG